MPMVYYSDLRQITTAALCSATPNTDNDVWTIKPGSRNVGIQAMYTGGKGAGLTALSGIEYNIRTWAVATSTGTAMSSNARDPGFQAGKHTILSTNLALPTSGSGVQIFKAGCVSGAAGPGGWVAPNPDSVALLEGSTTSSMDLFVGSGTASLAYTFKLEIVE